MAGKQANDMHFCLIRAATEGLACGHGYAGSATHAACLDVQAHKMEDGRQSMAAKQASKQMTCTSLWIELQKRD